MLMPSSSTSPSDGISMRFTQRSSVDLPAPLGPIKHDDLARGDREIDPIDHRDVAEDLRQAADATAAASARHASRFSTYSENHASTEMITR